MNTDRMVLEANNRIARVYITVTPPVLKVRKRTEMIQYLGIRLDGYRESVFGISCIVSKSALNIVSHSVVDAIPTVLWNCLNFVEN